MARNSPLSKPVTPEGDQLIILAIEEALKEARQARKRRDDLSKVNLDAYMGIQDWSHKTRGQSTEFLPKVPMAVETMAAFIKRGLTQFGRWFSVEYSPDSQIPIPEEAIQKLLTCYLDRLYIGNNKYTRFSTQISDGTKAALLESLYIFKVHGNIVSERRPFVEEGSDSIGEIIFKSWKLRIDLIPRNDYFPDPTGRGLYEIHRVERDLHDVVEMAEAGVYDKSVVSRLKEDVIRRRDEHRRAEHKGHSEERHGTFRTRVVIDEYWGSIINHSGKVIHKNILCARANDRFLIRKPIPNPLWHKESPFVVAPLIRVPFSVWHKALYDDASPLNLALNEIFNLMLDGGIASVWGIKQLRTNHLVDPRQVSAGIPQGITLAVKDSLPINAKVLETISEGKVPQDAMLIFETISREFNAAALTNEIKLGSLPAKEVKATEVIEATQSQAVTVDSMVSDIEKELMSQVLRKAFLTILQNADDLDSAEVVNAIGTKAALLLARLSPAERYSLFSPYCSFKVFGLSAIINRTKDFQKIMALMQVVATNPILFQAFIQRFSGDKILTQVMKTLNLNPEDMEVSRDDQGGQQRNQQILQLQASMSGGQSAEGQGLGSEDTGGPELPAEVNQLSNPLSGIAGA